MPKKREDPRQWMSDETVPDSECTITELWSRYHIEIAAYRKFKKTENTIYEYTAALKPIARYLGEKPACQMSAFDIWDAVISVRGRVNSKNEYVPYSNGTFIKRLSAIKDIYLFAEAKNICINPLRACPWEIVDSLNFERNSEEIRELVQEKAKRKILPRYLSATQEKRLMREILAHIEEDGRWLGLAIILWCGPRPSEVRALHFYDFKAFDDHVERGYVHFCRSADEHGNEKPTMKNRFGPRAIVEHTELQHVVDLRMNFIRESLDIDDIGRFPAVCFENNFDRACTATELANFASEKLRMLFGKEFYEDVKTLMYVSPHKPEDEVDGDEPERAVDSAADLEVTARLLRRNFATKNYAETKLEDWESRLEMGHETESETSFGYGEAHLWEMLLAMDHRMILPEIHPGWHTICYADMDFVDIVDAGIHYITVPREHLAELDSICIDIDLENAGDDFFMEFARRFPQQALKIDVRYSSNNGCRGGRINTDAAHWRASWDDAREDTERRLNREK